MQALALLGRVLMSVIFLRRRLRQADGAGRDHGDAHPLPPARGRRRLRGGRGGGTGRRRAGPGRLEDAPGRAGHGGLVRRDGVGGASGTPTTPCR